MIASKQAELPCRDRLRDFLRRPIITDMNHAAYAPEALVGVIKSTFLWKNAPLFPAYIRSQSTQSRR